MPSIESNTLKLKFPAYGNVYIAPDSCDPFPAGFWGVPTIDQINRQQEIANLPTDDVIILLGALGADGAELLRLF